MGGSSQRVERVDGWVRRHPVLPDALLALALAALLAPTTVGTLLDAESWARWPPAVIVVASHAGVALRRLRPEAAYAVCCAQMLVLVAIEVPYDLVLTPATSVSTIPAILLPSSLVFPILLYAVVLHGRARSGAPALLVAAVGAVAVAVRLGVESDLLDRLGPIAVLALIAALIGSVVAPWSLAQLRRTRSAYDAALEERAARAERERIAREMHDVVAHSLSVMVAQAEAGRMVARRDATRAAAVLDTIAVTGREAMTDMRSLIGVLRHGGDPDGEPQPTLAGLPDLVGRVNDAGLSATLQVDGVPVPLGRIRELAAYRVVQEALTNVVKHAGPDARAEVRMHWTDSALTASVTDDGVGATAGSPGGHGILGMRERVADLGGTVEAAPARGGGFAVHLRLPVDGEASP